MVFLPSLSLPLLLFLLNTHFPNPTSSYAWWTYYPNCAWHYLDAAVPTTCAATVDQLTVVECLCDSKTFLTTAAKGIGLHCSCGDLNKSAEAAVSICATYVGNISVSADQFVADGTPCNASATDSAHAAVTSDLGTGAGGSAGGGGLSAGATAAVSVISAVFTVVGVFLAPCTKRRKSRKRQREEEKGEQKPAPARSPAQAPDPVPAPGPASAPAA